MHNFLIGLSECYKFSETLKNASESDLEYIDVCVEKINSINDVKAFHLNHIYVTKRE